MENDENQKLVWLLFTGRPNLIKVLGAYLGAKLMNLGLKSA